MTCDSVSVCSHHLPETLLNARKDAARSMSRQAGGSSSTDELSSGSGSSTGVSLVQRSS